MSEETFNDVLVGFESTDRSPPGVPVSWWNNAIHDVSLYRGGTDSEVREAFPQGGFLLLDGDGHVTIESRDDADIEDDILKTELRFFENEEEIVDSLLGYLVNCGFPHMWIYGTVVSTPLLTVHIPGLDTKLRERLKRGDEPFSILMDFRKVAGMINKKTGWSRPLVEAPYKTLGWLYAWRRMMDEMEEFDREEQSDPELETAHLPGPLQNHAWHDNIECGPGVWSNEKVVRSFVAHVINIRGKAVSYDDFLARCNRYLGKVREANKKNSVMPLRDLHKVVGIMLAASEKWKSYDRVEIKVSHIINGRALSFIPKSAHVGDFLFNIHSQSKFKVDCDEYGWIYAQLKKVQWSEDIHKARNYWLGNLRCGRNLLNPSPPRIPVKGNDLFPPEVMGPLLSWDKEFERKVLARGNDLRALAKLGQYDLVETGETRVAVTGGKMEFVEVIGDPFASLCRRSRGETRRVPVKKYVPCVRNAARYH